MFHFHVVKIYTFVHKTIYIFYKKNHSNLKKEKKNASLQIYQISDEK